MKQQHLLYIVILLSVVLASVIFFKFVENTYVPGGSGMFTINVEEHSNTITSFNPKIEVIWNGGTWDMASFTSGTYLFVDGNYLKSIILESMPIKDNHDGSKLNFTLYNTVENIVPATSGAHILKVIEVTSYIDDVNSDHCNFAPGCHTKLAYEACMANVPLTTETAFKQALDACSNVGIAKEQEVTFSTGSNIEICDNKIDDNADNMIDCKDSQCKNSDKCKSNVPLIAAGIIISISLIGTTTFIILKRKR